MSGDSPHEYKSLPIEVLGSQTLRQVPFSGSTLTLQHAGMWPVGRQSPSTHAGAAGWMLAGQTGDGKLTGLSPHRTVDYFLLPQVSMGKL